VAIVLGILAVYIHYALGRAGTPIALRDTSVATTYQEQIVNAVKDFARRNYRLPCADTSGNGLEGADAGCGNDNTQHIIGGVPYKTLGILPPSSVGQSGDGNYLYGVFRTAAADLAAVGERTGSAPVDGEYRARLDMAKALRDLASAATDFNRLRVTGDQAAMGAWNCAGNATNVAFLVVFSGARNADGTGTLFDGPQTGLAWPAGGTPCVAAPSTPVTETYDDTVRAIGFAELLGVLTR